MKMQKTEMEIVTFDAQDVIATSGGGSISFLVTGNLFDLAGDNMTTYFPYDENNAYWGSDGLGFYIREGGTTTGPFLSNNKYYTIAPGAKYSYDPIDIPNKDGNGFLSFTIGLTEGNTGTTTYTKLSDIINWLESNGISTTQ